MNEQTSKNKMEEKETERKLITLIPMAMDASGVKNWENKYPLQIKTHEKNYNS